MKDSAFDDLRPYCDEEIAPAMERIACHEYFPLLAGYVFPGRDVEQVRQMVKRIATVDGFQLQVMKAVNEEVVRCSIRRFSFEGLDRLDRRRRYLFVSNHRDIMLDATLFQYALYLTGHRTSEITFGSNLMSSQLAIDIGRSNKMFKVVRGGSVRDFYANLLHLSQYIRHTVCEKRESVWIAQRNGRTKDGRDATDPAIVKMFCMSAPDGGPVRALAELNIVPVAVSYQWETCDGLKAVELYRSRTEKYVKQPGEDMNSILTGITQPKGDVHIAVGTLLTENILASFDSASNSRFCKQAATWISNRIVANCRLTCNNFIAHDLRSGDSQYAAHYTQAEKDCFVAHCSATVNAAAVADRNALRDILLGIYANPVDAQRALDSMTE
ncbi:MAG: acyltransferase [Tannerella sp.]|nr:acyltransferase [Tannerella sp.]